MYHAGQNRQCSEATRFDGKTSGQEAHSKLVNQSESAYLISTSSHEGVLIKTYTVNKSEFALESSKSVARRRRKLYLNYQPNTASKKLFWAGKSANRGRVRISFRPI